ncbi:unnamed protein product [Protopolystoma xenopodis]|uniref:Uncharacterized protein n=1 Tax=Protopolystoma xenopodis TaxID=117903 RepID=A0A3S5BXI0_9PLAT|nr:unnamed protein product [Protopolystoma xenopodis]
MANFYRDALSGQGGQCVSSRTFRWDRESRTRRNLHQFIWAKFVASPTRKQSKPVYPYPVVGRSECCFTSSTQSASHAYPSYLQTVTRSVNPNLCLAAGNSRFSMSETTK